MVIEDDEEANRLTHNGMIQSRMSIQNHVLTRRREQLKIWETSEMNRLPPHRRDPAEMRVHFHDNDVFFSACVNSDTEEVLDLLRRGVNINTTTIDGVTALHQSVIDDKIDMVRFLVDHGADVTAQDNEGWTPLHAAVCCDNFPIVQYLYEQGADITIVSTDKQLPVDLCEDNETDQIKVYLNEKLEQKGLTPEECRAKEENVMMNDCMNWIRTSTYLGKPHPRTGATPLHVAASKGYNRLIPILVKAGADVNAQDFEGWTPLHAAAHWGERQACDLLIARGADINAETHTGNNVLRVADSDIVDFLQRLHDEQQKRMETNARLGERPFTARNGHSLSPPPAKRPHETAIISTAQEEIDNEDEADEENEDEDEEHEESMSSSVATPATTATIHLSNTYQNVGTVRNAFESPRPTHSDFKSESSQSTTTPSVQAVLPAPRLYSESSSSYTGTSSSYTGSSAYSSSQSKSATASGSTENDNKEEKENLPRQNETPTPVSHRKPSSITSRLMNSPRRHESIDDEEQSVITVSSASEASNTSASISSIATRSRSMTPKETSSSLYSSDQSIKCSVKLTSAPPPPTSAEPQTSQKPTEKPASSTEQKKDDDDGNTQQHRPSWRQTDPVKQAPLARISISPSTESLGSNSEGSVMFRKPAVPPHQSPTKKTSIINKPAPSASSIIQRFNNITQPTIASTHRQRLMARSQSVSAEKTLGTLPPTNPNAPPWVSHWKSEKGIIQVGGGAKNTVSGMIKVHEQQQDAASPRPLQVYRKSVQQTPPTQPAPQKESEAERKAKSRLQRASRRSTQGVTLEQLGCASNSSSAQSTPTSSRQQNRPEDEVEPRWRASHGRLPVSSVDLLVPAPVSSFRQIDTSRTSTPPTRSTVPTALSQLSTQTPPTLPGETPSAAKMRRSQLFRANRRGTGPVDMEALSTNSTTSTVNASDDTKFVVPELPSHRLNGATSFTTPVKNGDLVKANGDKSYKILYEEKVGENDRLKRELENMRIQSTTAAPAQSGQTVSGAVRRPLTGGAGAGTLGSTTSSTSSSTAHPPHQPASAYSPNRHDSASFSHSSSYSDGRSHLDSDERARYERRIADLEQKLNQVQSDQKRLKDENNALIRVISKLSKDPAPRPPTSATPTVAGITNSSI